MPDFLPSREAELVTWSTTFKNLSTLTPTDYGLSAAQATAYEGLHDSWLAAFNAANADQSNSRSAIIAKNLAKSALKREARVLAGIIQKHPGTTDVQRADLGLTVPDLEPTPVPPPAFTPQATVKSVNGRLVTIRLRDSQNPDKRARPAGVSGAAVLSYVGDEPPQGLGEWKYEGVTSLTTVEILFPLSVPVGAKVWITAQWFNPRKQTGPGCVPIATHIGYGDMLQAA